MKKRITITLDVEATDNDMADHMLLLTLKSLEAPAARARMLEVGTHPVRAELRDVAKAEGAIEVADYAQVE